MAIQTIPRTLIADNAINAAKIASGIISADDIADNSLTAAKISASTSPTFGGLTVDTDTLVVDSANNRVGIGTSSPSHLLELVRSSTDFGATLEINNTNSANGSVGAMRFVTESESTGLIIGKHSGGHGIADLAFINQELNADLAISTNNTERMRIDSSGNVGIGTSSPDISGFSKALTIDSADSGIELASSGTIQGIFAANTQGAAITGVGSSGIRVFTSASGSTTERMRIDSSGNVGIGTDSPDYKLDFAIGSTIRLRHTSAAGSAIRIGASDYDVNLIRFDGSSGQTDNSYYGGSLRYMGSRSSNANSLSIFMDNSVGTEVEAMTIQQNGTVGIGTSSPTSLLTLGTGTFSPAATNTSALYTSATDGMVALADGFLWGTRGGADRMKIESDGKIQIGNNIPMWSGQYGGALILKGNNATSDRHARLTVVDSTGAAAYTGLIVSNTGRVGIGTAGPNALLEVNGGDGFFYNTASSGGIRIGYNSSNYWDIKRENASVGNLRFYHNGVERVSFLPGGGITFNGDTAAANALDDYEEGTWTPADDNGNNYNTSGVQATYTKIGRLVYFNFDIQNTQNTSGTKISGLPFTSSASSVSNNWSVYGGYSTSDADLWGHINASSTRINMYVGSTAHTLSGRWIGAGWYYTG